MNNEDLNFKLKEILIKMNSTETDLELFYEIVEKESGGALTFSNFKVFLDKYYNSISKRN